MNFLTIVAVLFTLLSIVDNSLSIEIVVADQETQPSVKAPRSSSDSSGTLVNSIGVNTSAPKYQQVAPTVKTHEYSQQNTIYGQQPVQQATGYLVAVNLNGNPQNQIQTTGQPQYVMQYLPQNNQQAPNGYQYFQIVQTQPMVFPNGYMLSTVPNQYYNYPNNGPEIIGQPQAIHGVSQQHPIQQQQQPRVQTPYNSYNYPVHQFQDAINQRNTIPFIAAKPVINSLTGQVTQGINLNTNEYLPPQTESGFRAMKNRQVKI